LLRVAALTAWHGRRGSVGTVLREASLSVPARGCLAVIGRSGSGKTTLARCLAGLHRNWSGTALLDGQPLPASLRDRTRDQLAAVQYVFQDARASFDEHRSVLDQIARTAVRLRGAAPEAARAQARALLDEVGLPETTVGRRPAGLSGGELQRAALARALLAQPRVLLLDEVTSGLDPDSRAAVTALLAGLRSRTSLVLITHDLGFAAELAEQVAVVHDGRVVESGPAPVVLEAPAHPASRRLLAAGVRLGQVEGGRRR
jgi:peptide/nickel transport system ATP-binding protein